MSAVKRWEPMKKYVRGLCYPPMEITPTMEVQDDGSYILATDHDSLLAALRRCVDWMEEQFCPGDIDCENCHEGREIVAAARALLAR